MSAKKPMLVAAAIFAAVAVGIALCLLWYVRGISFSATVCEDVVWGVLVPFLALLAFAVGCMFSGRGAYPPSQPSLGGSAPPEPPTEGAPRPAPLVPSSPLIQSAHAELPNDRNA